MVVGAMKCFNKSTLTVMKRLKQDGFVSQHRLKEFEERVSSPDHWRRTQNLAKFCKTAQGENVAAVLDKMKAVRMSLRDVFTHILFFSTYKCSVRDKCWKFYETCEDVFKHFDCEGNTVSVAIDDITTFIPENWIQWQDWILAKLQQAAGLEDCRGIGGWMIGKWSVIWDSKRLSGLTT